MKYTQYEQEHEQQETSSSVVQRLLAKKKFINEEFSRGNKTAQERRLNKFYDKEGEGRVQSSVKKR